MKTRKGYGLEVKHHEQLEISDGVEGNKTNMENAFGPRSTCLCYSSKMNCLKGLAHISYAKPSNSVA